MTDQRARKVARIVGLVAKKSRWRNGTIDNLGHFMLIDPSRNLVVAGERFDMTAEQVCMYCLERCLERTWEPAPN